MTPSPPSDADVRVRAYNLWRERACPIDQSEAIWLAAEAQLRPGCPPRSWLFPILLILFALLWLMTALACILFAGKPAATTPATTTSSLSPTTLPALLIPTSSLKGKPSRAAEWERAKAIEFGLTHMSERLSAGLVAAGAILWFAMKFLCEELKPTPAQRRPHHAAVILFWNVIWGCLFSIGFGFLAMLYFASLPTADTFDLYGDLKSCAEIQLSSMLVVAFLLVSAIGLVAHMKLIGGQQ